MDATRAILQISFDSVERLVDRIMANPVGTAKFLKGLAEEVEELRLAIGMLQDASGLFVQHSRGNWNAGAPPGENILQDAVTCLKVSKPRT